MSTRVSGRIDKTELYAVAAEMFAQNGYPATSIRMISDRIGVKPGSLYYHIKAKDDLLFGIIDTSLDKLIRQVEPIVASDMEPSEKLREALTAHLIEGCSTTNEMIVTIRESGHLTGDRAALIAQKRHYYEDMFRSLLEVGVASGQLRSAHIKLSTYAAMGMCNWICQLYRPSGPLTPQEIAKNVVSMIIDGLAVGRDPAKTVFPA